MNKYDKFPAKVYVDSFLKPDLFIYKNIFKDALFQVNYAQCIMLNEQSIINDKEAKLNNMLGTGEDFILTEYNSERLS